MNALVLYDSLGGNTEKVAKVISIVIEKRFKEVTLVHANSFDGLDLMNYDLIFIGTPVIDWLPTEDLMNFLKSKLNNYAERGVVKPSAPKVFGKFVVCFCTFAGPHIGVNEALPATMWMASFFEHIGYTVLDQWQIVGEFHKDTDMNTNGRLGNILGRPNEHDLKDVSNRTEGILDLLANFTNS